MADPATAMSHVLTEAESSLTRLERSASASWPPKQWSLHTTDLRRDLKALETQLARLPDAWQPGGNPRQTISFTAARNKVEQSSRNIKTNLDNLQERSFRAEERSREFYAYTTSSEDLRSAIRQFRAILLTMEEGALADAIAAERAEPDHVLEDQPGPRLRPEKVMTITGLTRFVLPLGGEPGAITAVGDDVAVAVGDKVYIVAAEIGEIVQQFSVTSPVTALASMLGVVVAGTKDGVVAVMRRQPDSAWDVQLLVGHGAAVTGLGALEGRLLTASVDGTVRVWDLRTGGQLQAFHHRVPVRHLVGQASTGHVVSADDSGRVCWWDAATGMQQRPLRGHGAPVTALLMVEPMSVISAGQDGTVWRWRLLPDASEDHQLLSGGPAVVGASRMLTPVSRSAFVSWDETGQIAWWDHDGRRWAVRLEHDIQTPIRTVLCDDLSEEVLVIHTGGVLTVAPPKVSDDPVEVPYVRQLALLDADTVVLGTPGGTVQHYVSSANWVDGTTGSAAAGLAALYDRNLLAAWANGTAEIWRGEQGKAQLVSLRSPARLVTAAGREGVVCEADGRLVRVTTDGSALPGSLPKVPQATALAASGSPQDYLLVGDAIGDVTIIREGSTVSVANAGQAPVTAVAAVGEWCVAGTADGTVLRWQPNQQAMTVLGVHEGPVEGVAVVGTKLAASASLDGSVRLWDVEDGIEHAIVAGPEPFHAAAFAADVQRLYVRAGADALWLLDLEPDTMATEPENVLIAEPRPGLDTVEMVSGGVSVTAGFELRCTVPCEIRAAQLRIDPAPTWFPPTSRMLMSFDPDARFLEPLDQDGRLAVPRRFRPERSFVLTVRQEFPGVLFGVVNALTVRLLFVTPNLRREVWVEIYRQLGQVRPPESER